MTNACLAEEVDAEFQADVLDGLARPKKRLQAKYFYDETGSRLFDRITELPEYYPTRTELQILRDHAPAMAQRCGSRCSLIELGAGSLAKVRLLIDRLDRPAGYVPVDVSGEHLRAAATLLAEDYPTLNVVPVVADFTKALDCPDIPSHRRVVYFPGSTLGNFDPEDADALLSRVAKLIGPGGGMLLGVDLRKDPVVLELAYNDAAGVTSAFNRNLLVRINRELGANFDVDTFRHHAFFNHERSRIEMHLVSLVEQSVHIGDSTVHFREGESIHTENSYKYDLAELTDRAARCGLRVDESWTDPRRRFAVLFLTAS